jgi:hypothetical protein
MYSHCLNCGRGLGRNSRLPQLPVGRRIAFDSARGRLWVVCTRCEQWCLTPIEERWEAVAECERLFSASAIRVSTGEIGLAKPAGGPELIRIGDAQRDEIANWRYATRLRRRRTLAALGTALTAMLFGSALLLAETMSGALIAVLWTIALVFAYGRELLQWRAQRRPIRIRLEDPDGVVRAADGTGVNMIELVPDDLTGLTVACRYVDRRPVISLRVASAAPELTAASAIRVLALVLPRMNWRGAGGRDVREAVKLVDKAEQASADAASRGEHTVTPWERLAIGPYWRGVRLVDMTLVERLALEMAVAEEMERHALAGQAAELRERWAEAEEVASVSDNMLLPRAVTEWLARRRLQPPAES